jgi:hypothetical protein
MGAWADLRGLILIDAHLLALSVVRPLLLLFSIRFICELFPSLCEMLLGLQEIILRDIWTLTFFIINVAVCILWYSLRFDPENIVNPTRMSIWG